MRSDDPSLGEEDAEAGRTPERLPAKFPTPPPRQGASMEEEERTRTSGSAGGGGGGGGGGGAAAAPLTTAADIMRAVAASLEQQLRLMRQLYLPVSPYRLMRQLYLPVSPCISLYLPTG